MYTIWILSNLLVIFIINTRANKVGVVVWVPNGFESHNADRLKISIDLNFWKAKLIA